MRCKIFSIAVESPAALEQERALNEFLDTTKVKRIFASLVTHASGPIWSAMFFYDEGTKAVPATPADGARAVAPGPTAGARPAVQPNVALTGEQVRMIMALKKWRANEAALANVPLYKIAQNRWLEEIVQLPARSLDDLRKVTGMGDWRVQKYGARILEIVNETKGTKSLWPAASRSAGQA